jgi:molecular chaperone DnaJ
MICRIVVETPVNLTRHQKDLLRKLDEAVREGGEKHSPRAHGWLDGVKDFFEDLKFWSN